MENLNQQEQEVELTAEELAEKKNQMLKFYTESLHLNHLSLSLSILTL